LITVLPKGIKFNTNHYLTDILVPLLEWRKTQVGGSNRKLIVLADNPRPSMVRVTLEFLKQNGMKSVPHPPYSPDLAPSGSYLLSLRLHQATLGGTRIP
jgi:histone-lysine N-methyltransferase SETMAR